MSASEICRQIRSLNWLEERWWGAISFRVRFCFSPRLPHPDLEDRGGRDARPILNRV
jgi:hypothetical protein